MRKVDLIVWSGVALLVGLVISGCKDDTPHVKTAARNPKQLENQNLPRAQTARATEPPQLRSTGTLEPVAELSGPMPTGVAVSRTGRIFVTFPRWGDPVEYTVAEIRGDKIAPYPDLEFNKLRTDDPADSLVSVQSVVVDPQDRLWILDTGSINLQPVRASSGGPKLVCYDLSTNKLVKRITFPENVCLNTTYLNDVRFNLNMGPEGTAFITDSSDSGPNGIIVVDIASGESWRRLNDHPSTKADPSFAPNVEGNPLMARLPGQPPAYLKIGTDGIAVSNDGRTLYYCPLASHKLSSASTEALADRNRSDDEVARTVKQIAVRDYASDGLECDNRGNLYLTDYEHNAIHRRSGPNMQNDQIIVQDQRMIWPDSMSIGTDQYLYVTANQLNRQPRFHNGVDQRKEPYVLFRTRINAGPVAPGQSTTQP
jgi:sugar lactone lactonase YvrE